MKELTSLVLKERFGNDLAREIKSFMWHDVRTVKYARSLIEKDDARYKMLWYIDNSSSRKNGFEGMAVSEEPETEDPHWIFVIPFQVQMQAITCKKCGNYIISNTIWDIHPSHWIICSCAF